MLKTIWDSSNKPLNVIASLVTKFRGNRMPIFPQLRQLLTST